MNAHLIGFRDGSFDVVVTDGVLHHLSIAKAAGEIHRILKPGAFICAEPLLTVQSCGPSSRLAAHRTSANPSLVSCSASASNAPASSI
jgi:ubiquinone/menaquinone biosynthesis C-methylase UbiE